MAEELHLDSAVVRSNLELVREVADNQMPEVLKLRASERWKRSLRWSTRERAPQIPAVPRIVLSDGGDDLPP